MSGAHRWKVPVLPAGGDWRPVASYNGAYRERYLVNAAGEVWSTRGGRILRAIPNKVSLYPSVDIRAEGQRHVATVHRLVLEAFVGLRPAGMVARHLNGDRSDPRLENLAWGTLQENADDQTVHGTRRRGETAGNAILSEAQVREIRRLRSNGATYRSIAGSFPVSDTTVFRVCDRSRWRHVV